MTNALEQISKKGLEEQTVVFGGMNLAMALTATLMKDDVDTELLKDSLISEAKMQLKSLYQRVELMMRKMRFSIRAYCI